MTRWPVLHVLVAGLLLGGCRLNPGVQYQGDVAYREGRYGAALDAYRRASSGTDQAGIWAKLAAAATKTGDYREAVEAYHRLAAADSSRWAEAVQGIARVADAALAQGDWESVREAVFGMGAMAPERHAGRVALALIRSETIAGPEAMRLLPVAMGAASGPTADSLLAHYASSLRQYGTCEQAIEAYRSLDRRTASQDLSIPRRPEHASCALELGLGSLAAVPWTAEDLFYEALAIDSTSAVGRRALVGLGDARVAQGDYLGAAAAFQAAIDLASGTDTISDLAVARLNAIASADPDVDSAGGGR